MTESNAPAYLLPAVIANEELPVPVERVRELVEKCHSAVLLNDADMGVAAVIAKATKEAWKALDEKRKSMTEPLRAHEKTINDAFRPFLETLNQAESALKVKQNAYDAKKRREAEEAARIERERQEQERLELAAKKEREAEEARKAGDLPAADRLAYEADHILEEAADAPAPVPVIPPKYGSDYGVSAGRRTTWEFEIVDINKVPREYFLLDEQRIKMEIRRARQPVREIPGLLIKQTTSITNR